MFTKPHRLPLNLDSVSQRFDGLVIRSGLPPIRLHNLRHVAATLALAAGVPMKVVFDQLGHASLAITADLNDRSGHIRVSPLIRRDAFRMSEP